MTLRQAGGRGLEGRITDAVTSTTWGCHCPGRHCLHLRAAPFASSAPENAVKGSASSRQMAHLTQQVGPARTGTPGKYAETPGSSVGTPLVLQEIRARRLRVRVDPRS